MSNLIFPDVSESNEDGFMGLSQTITSNDILNAYLKGIFPWPHNEKHIAWFSPLKRAVLRFEDLNFNRSIKRAIKNSIYTFCEVDDFEFIISSCRDHHKSKKHGTWITKFLIQAYTDAHKNGFAKSYAAFEGTKIVGGFYGIRINNYFSAESMFSLAPNASKLCLINILGKLHLEGVSWVDCQVLNPFTESLGAKEINREEFLQLFSLNF